MMKIDDILEMWKKDSVIDEINLDDTTIAGARLHAKYLELYTVSKLELKRQRLNIEKLKKNKWLYYTGKMSKAEMDELSWPYDPFNGNAKPLKSDLDYYINADPDVQKIMAKLEYQEQIVECLEEILGVLRWRHTNIRNIIEFRKFRSGC